MSTLSVDTIQGQTTAGTVKMPAGHVIQYVKDTGNTQVTVAANAYGNTDTSITFTPKYANSIIQIYWEGMFVKDANGSASLAYGIHKDCLLYTSPSPRDRH